MHIITDQDINPVLPALKSESWPVRSAARIILIDKDGAVALMYSAKHNYYKLPGGGIDEGESSQVAAKREALEETGYTVRIMRKLEQINEYRNHGFDRPYKQVNFYYLCGVMGEKALPKLTDSEVSDQFSVVWVSSIDKAIAKIDGNAHSDAGTAFMRLRELHPLHEVRRLLAQKNHQQIA